MTGKVFQYIIPGFLLLTSAAIVVWTGVIVKDDHSYDTFNDSPNKIPAINVGVGLMALVLFLTNLPRALGCYHGRGCCDSGLGFTTFILMLGAAAALFIQVAKLNDDERNYYKHEKTDYYDLTIGQMAFFCGYFALVLLQLLCCMCGCMSSCVKSDDDYDLEGGHRTVYF